MGPANPDRGEVDIELGGKLYPMRPSWQAINAIEAQGRTLAQVARDAQSEGLTVRFMAFCITECIRAAGVDRNDPMLRGVTIDKINELVAERGALNVLPELGPLFRNMLEGGVEDGKKNGVPDSPT